MTIRVANERDARSLLELYRAFIAAMRSFDAEAETDDVQLCEWIDEGIAGRIACIVVVDAGNRLAGFARISEKRRADTCDRQRYAKLNDLYVVPDARGNGLAKALIERSHAWAVERALPNVVLNVYRINTSARTLYERNGYELLREISNGRMMMIHHFTL